MFHHRSLKVIVILAVVSAAVSAPTMSWAKTKRAAANSPTTTTTLPPFQDLVSDSGAALKATTVEATGIADPSAATDVQEKCQPERKGIAGSTALCQKILWSTTAISGGLTGTLIWAMVSSGNNPAIKLVDPMGNAVFVGTIAGCGTGALVMQMAPTYIDPTHPPAVAPPFAPVPPYRIEIAHYGRYDDFIGIEGEGYLLPSRPAGPNAPLPFTIKLKVRCAGH